MTLTAPVKWAQRKGTVLVTIDLPDVEKDSAKIELTEKKLVFHGKSEEKDYELELEFLNEIDPTNEETKYTIRPRSIAFHLVKKEEESWPRLLENKALQKTNVKCDFDKWVDSDEEDGEGFDLNGMEGMGGMPGMGGMGGMPGMGGMGGMPGMGGMGGMPGMGGMGGMPGMGDMGGMGGMDMAKLMEQMKGMGGGDMPDMSGMGGPEMGEDSDDELPDLEDDEAGDVEGDAPDAADDKADE